MRTRCALVWLLCTAAAAAHSQTFAGGERENYLRYLQTVRLVPVYPWGARAFSPAELDGLTVGRSDRKRLLWLPVAGTVHFNSTFPYGFNDGPVWAGKGGTLVAEGGFTLRRGVVSLTLAPLAFLAQNARFPVSSDSTLEALIDRPERLENGSYARLDPGQSTLRVDWRALAAGFSTANEFWGPATEFPIILGNNAPGFPHLFLGTAHPVKLGPINLHGRVIWGRLEQSAFSAETVAAGRRLGTGIVLDLTSRWVPGLEIGAIRFSHQRWRPGGPTLDDALAVFKASEKGLEAGNDLASVFFRWVLPNSGLEVYGEYGRDDYSSTFRGFLLRPDHAGGYTVGFRKVVSGGRESGLGSWGRHRFVAVRVEFQNLQLSNIAQGRAWSPLYTNVDLRQGHTQRGQVLGSEAGPGGAGSVVAVDAYSASGRWTWSWTRMIREQRGDPSGATPDPNGVDVQHALSVERTRTRGRHEMLLRVTGVYELNRNYSYDAFNLNLMVGFTLADPGR